MATEDDYVTIRTDEEVRDRLREQKPDGVSWARFFETLLEHHEIAKEVKDERLPA